LHGFSHGRITFTDILISAVFPQLPIHSHPPTMVTMAPHWIKIQRWTTARNLDFLDARATKTKGQLIYAAAAKKLGTPYVWGGGNCAGKTKGGFDCSGTLIIHIFPLLLWRT
jgi:cell wall-associated NlpC family hydrolase